MSNDINKTLGEMPKVYNKRRPNEIPEGAVYVGRPSRWGNPYKTSKTKTREQAIREFQTYLDFSDTDELKDLCFDKDSITAGYSSKEQAFLVSATVKNDRTKIVVFRIRIHGLTSVMQFGAIKKQVLDRAS